MMGVITLAVLPENVAINMRSHCHFEDRASRGSDLLEILAVTSVACEASRADTASHGLSSIKGECQTGTLFKHSQTPLRNITLVKIFNAFLLSFIDPSKEARDDWIFERADSTISAIVGSTYEDMAYYLVGCGRKKMNRRLNCSRVVEMKY